MQFSFDNRGIIHVRNETLFIGLLLFYVLATCMVISGRAETNNRKCIQFQLIITVFIHVVNMCCVSLQGSGTVFVCLLLFYVLVTSKIIS